jgi:hypothetical protein
VMVGLVEYVEPCRREGPSELLQDGVAGIHGFAVSGVGGQFGC